MDQLKLLEDRFTAEMNEQEKSRLREIIAFRVSQEAQEMTSLYKKTYPAEYIDRAIAYLKVVSLGYEDTPEPVIKGSLLGRLTARWDLSKNPIAQQLKKTAGGLNQGMLSGCMSDLAYQSPVLFPDFGEGGKADIGQAAGILNIESRNRYRRVYWLTTGQERIDYFNMLREQGLGTTDNPILIASIGGGTGSVEMDMQQELKERYDIATRIVVFEVMAETRELGSYFARMRGADIAWVVNKPGEDDLLALQQQGVLDKKAGEPLKARDPKGGEITISQDLEGVFQHVIMNSLWEYYSDEQAAGWLQVAGKLLATEGRAVVSLMRNTYQDSSGQDQLIPVFRKSSKLGLDPERMYYRTMTALEKNGLVEKAGFVIKDRVDGTVFPVISLEKR